TGEGLPVARITVDRRVGLMPLTVTFDGVESTGGKGNIIEYDWDFGDGKIAIGTRVTHTFEPESTDEFTVTLFVWNDQGEVGADQVEIVVIVPAGQTGDEEPVAEVTASEPDMIFESEDRPSIPSLFRVEFDPRGSYADAGHQIDYYVWDFGDETVQVEESGLEVTHIYELRAIAHTYVARLTVYDDQGLEGIATINVSLVDDFGVDEDED
ncbi:MAG: PKD domain-containing protein, partial [Candidatus Bipolaricaulia bacterium]